MNVKQENHWNRICAAIREAISEKAMELLCSNSGEMQQQARVLALRRYDLSRGITDSLLRQYSVRERGPR